MFGFRDCCLLQIVDLPTITESYKTIDGKNFYKTADICQVSLSESYSNIKLIIITSQTHLRALVLHKWIML